jgi:hypothetical protein
LLEHLIEAFYQKEKLAKLRAANVDLEKLRHLLQISTEMRFISLDQLAYASRSLKIKVWRATKKEGHTKVSVQG